MKRVQSSQVPSILKLEKWIIYQQNRNMSDFYINAENDENKDDDHNKHPQKLHLILLKLIYIWNRVQRRHTSYSALAKVAARVFGVPATSAAVEREFSFSGNIIMQKRSKLSADIVN